MTTVYLGWMGKGSALRALGQRAGKMALLVAFPFVDEFDRCGGRRLAREWALDSGAFTAMNTGKPIDLGAYIDYATRALEGPNPPADVFGLDVIGDPEASMRNIDRMQAAGVPAIPTFHYGTDIGVLRELCASFPKVGLGGIGGNWTRTTIHDRIRYLDSCFAACWPHQFHGFGIGAPRRMRRYPFHTVDATTWMISPQRYRLWAQFGEWRTFVRTKVPRSNDLEIVGEVDWYLEREREMKALWRREMERIA